MTYIFPGYCTCLSHVSYKYIYQISNYFKVYRKENEYQFNVLTEYSAIGGCLVDDMGCVSLISSPHLSPNKSMRMLQYDLNSQQETHSLETNFCLGVRFTKVKIAHFPKSRQASKLRAQ